MAASCPNCGTCTCTGSYLVMALNGAQVCSQCVGLYNQVHQVQPQVKPQVAPVKTKQ